MRIFISREQLHQQVWSMPMTKLAPIYGVKNYELKKICDRFLVPTPKSGYWSKLSFGKSENITPLPRWKNCIPCNMIVKNKNQTATSLLTIVDIPAEKHKPIKIVELASIKADHGVTVKKNLTTPHDLIEKAQKELKTCSPDKYGRLSTRRAIAINVSHDNIKRALLVMDAIFKWFEKLGYKVRKPSNESSRTLIVVDGIDIEIEIMEKSKLSGKVKSHWGYEYSQYKPSGDLTLKINTYTYDSMIQTNWSDGKMQTIEDILNGFIDSVFAIVVVRQNENKRREQEYLLSEERRKNRIYEEQCAQYENQLIEKLIKQSNDMAISTRIREYIFAVERRARMQFIDANYPKELSDWLEWAKKQADHLDPLNEQLPSYISAKEIIDKSKIR
jgi:hypothetical protein